MQKEVFGTTKTGVEACKYEISNKNGMKVVVSDYGATIVAVYVKDKNGELRDVVLGYDDLASYENETCYFGATVGRNANRIANASYVIDGVTYKMEVNDNENNLHSGKNGVSDKVWAVEAHTESAITFSIVSKDMEQDFPGNATMKVTYEVSEDGKLAIKYHVVSDKKTVINMTNHSYFNLAGHEKGDVLDQELCIAASNYTPVINSHAIPTGEVAPVAGTPFDFTTVKTIGQDIKADFEQLVFGNGYDHNYAIDKKTAGMEKIVTAYCEESGIQMDVYTELPGVQLYTGNFVDGQVGKGGVKYVKHSGFCLETQYFPNAVNEPSFASPVYDANEAYISETVYAFSVK